MAVGVEAGVGAEVGAEEEGLVVAKASGTKVRVTAGPSEKAHMGAMALEAVLVAVMLEVVVMEAAVMMAEMLEVVITARGGRVVAATAGLAFEKGEKVVETRVERVLAAAALEQAQPCCYTAALGSSRG